MIQFDKDGMTLFYIDASGNRVQHNPFDGQAYSDMLVIRSAQMQAGIDNQMAVRLQHQTGERADERG